MVIKHQKKRSKVTHGENVSDFFLSVLGLDGRTISARARALRGGGGGVELEAASSCKADQSLLYPIFGRRSCYYSFYHFTRIFTESTEGGRVSRFVCQDPWSHAVAHTRSRLESIPLKALSSSGPLRA